MRTGTSGLIAAALMLVAGSSAAGAGSFMVVSGRTTQPVGHYEFCLQYRAECAQTAAKPRPLDLTRPVWDLLIDVNNAVNASVTPKTDKEIWGVDERWSYPDGVGDCEDYVLEKRRRLMEAGLPASALLITVVRQRNGDGHAVLTVNTSYGDFVLDNLEGRVLAWDATGYAFIKRQSARNSGVWLSITDDRMVAVGSVR